MWRVFLPGRSGRRKGSGVNGRDLGSYQPVFARLGRGEQRGRESLFRDVIEWRLNWDTAGNIFSTARRTGIRSQESGIRNQSAGIRGQKSGAAGQICCGQRQFLAEAAALRRK